VNGSRQNKDVLLTDLVEQLILKNNLPEDVPSSLADITWMGRYLDLSKTIGEVSLQNDSIVLQKLCPLSELFQKKNSLTTGVLLSLVRYVETIQFRVLFHHITKELVEQVITVRWTYQDKETIAYVLFRLCTAILLRGACIVKFGCKNPFRRVFQKAGICRHLEDNCGVNWKDEEKMLEDWKLGKVRKFLVEPLMEKGCVLAFMCFDIWLNTLERLLMFLVEREDVPHVTVDVCCALRGIVEHEENFQGDKLVISKLEGKWLLEYVEDLMDKAQKNEVRMERISFWEWKKIIFSLMWVAWVEAGEETRKKELFQLYIVPHLKKWVTGEEDVDLMKDLLKIFAVVATMDPCVQSLCVWKAAKPLGCLLTLSHQIGSEVQWEVKKIIRQMWLHASIDGVHLLSEIGGLAWAKWYLLRERDSEETNDLLRALGRYSVRRICGSVAGDEPKVKTRRFRAVLQELGVPDLLVSRLWVERCRGRARPSSLALCRSIILERIHDLNEV
jgi:hypothetical protein